MTYPFQEEMFKRHLAREKILCPCGQEDNLEHLQNCIFYEKLRNKLIEEANEIKRTD